MITSRKGGPRSTKGDDYSRPDPDDMPVVGGGLSLKASTDELRTEPNEQDELPDGGGGLPVEAPNRTRTKSYAVGRTFLSDLDGQECPSHREPYFAALSSHHQSFGKGFRSGQMRSKVSPS